MAKLTATASELIDLLNNNQEPFIILSGDAPVNSVIFTGTETLKVMLQAFNHDWYEVTGVYNGTRETSLIIPWLDYSQGLNLAAAFGQESVIIGSNEGVELAFTDGRPSLWSSGLSVIILPQPGEDYSCVEVFGGKLCFTFQF